MSEISFYRLSATLPLVLPLPAYLLASLTLPPRGVVDGLAVLIAASGPAGGPPYIPFMCVLLWCLRNKSRAAHRVASVFAPVIFVPVFILYLLVLAGLTPSPESFAENVMFYLPYLLGVGFAYVALVHVLRFVLSAFGWLDGGERPNTRVQPTPASGRG